METESWLRCSVSPGQFTGEFAVKGQLFDGSEFSLFVQGDFVECDETPLEGQTVDGSIRVEVREKKGDLCLIRLPRETMENGRFITVKASQLESAPRRQKV